ncbi:MAG: PilN domain-containing protein [Sedimentisphaerales bacterium]|nr:PilN domain-containing protein [Sedimentisphaerales bacterium]
MREINFLPEWYKEDRRQRLHRRRQYVVLAVAFIAMISYNLTSTHEITRASAELVRLETKRVEAQATFQEFNTVTKDLNGVREKADLIERIDSRIHIAAVLAEMSHIIGETVVLSRIEFTAEPPSDDRKSPGASDPGVRAADDGTGTSRGTLVGGVRFRIVLTGVAVSPADVAALVRRLDDSAYFRQVHASFWRSGKVRARAGASQAVPGPQAGTVSAGQIESLEVTEFEVVCYLANYEETPSR